MRPSTTSVFLAAACSSVALLLLGSTFAHASFECEKVWAQPSADNSLPKCMTDVDHLVNLIRDPLRMQYAGGIVLAVLCLVIGLLFYPLVVGCRYICRGCGGYKRRPGAFCGGAEWDDMPEDIKQGGYDERCVRIVYWLPFVMVVLCGVPMGFLLRGADTSRAAYDGVFSDVAGLAGYIETKMSNIRTTMTDNGKLIPPLQESYFDNGNDLARQLRTRVADQKSSFVQYVDMGKTIAICVGVIPIVFFIISAVFSFFHIRTCWPCLNSVFLFILVIAFGLVAMILLIIALVLKDACDEIHVYTNGRRPGIFSWYVVPMCKRDLPFDSLKNQMDNAEKDNSKKGCDSLMTVCNGTHNEWTFHKPNKVFYCNGLISSAINCTTFTNVSNFVNGTYLMSTQAGVGCGGVTPCTFRQCAKTCNVTTVKDNAASAVKFMDYAYKSTRAFNDHVRPILDCDHITTVALSALQSCSTFQEAFWLIGSGALIFQILTGFGIITVWVGQKRWFDTDLGPLFKDDGDNNSAAADNEPMNETTKGKRKQRKFVA